MRKTKHRALFIFLLRKSTEKNMINYNRPFLQKIEKKKTVENGYDRFNLLIEFFPGLDNHLGKYSYPVKKSRSFT